MGSMANRAGEEGGAAAAIAPGMVLAMPRARASLLQHQRGEDGRELRVLYAGGHEISFDDPRHFPFAERLSGAAFTAAEASEWGALGWAEAAPMLAELLAEGVLAPAEALPHTERHDHRPMANPLPPAPMPSPRCWMDGPALMTDLTGTALDLHWLEVVVPVFRTAHLFLDADGRQVGEANVFPPAARLAVPTDWRGCPYPGTRYQAEKPMNATALKAMRRHWRQMMALLGLVREHYLARFPEARAGWTLGHVERLTACALALPSLLLLDCAAPVANGALHPALSNLFRVVDGVRLVVHQILFVPVHEAMQRADAPITAEALLAYAERNQAFHSDHGVCAGPRFMVEDMLAMLLDGTTPRSGLDAALDPAVANAAARIPAAIDHALLGLATHAAAFTLWPAMAAAYQQLGEVLAHAAGPAGQAMASRFAGHLAALSARSFIADPAWRAHRAEVYDDMFAMAGQGLGDVASPPLSAQTAPVEREIPGLTETIAARLDPADAALAPRLAAPIAAFADRARKCLGLIERYQARQGALLSRPAPSRALTLADVNLHNVLMGADRRSVPFLPDELSALFGLTLSVSARAIQLEPAGPAAALFPDPLAGRRADAGAGGCPVHAHDGQTTVPRHT
jgi:hypothetical protein